MCTVPGRCKQRCTCVTARLGRITLMLATVPTETRRDAQGLFYVALKTFLTTVHLFKTCLSTAKTKWDSFEKSSSILSSLLYIVSRLISNVRLTVLRVLI